MRISFVTWGAGALCILLAGCASTPDRAGEERLYWRAPVLLPGVTPDQRSSGYWIGRLSQPDDLVMDGAQVDAFNQSVRTQRLVGVLPVAPGGAPGGLTGWGAQAQATFAWLAKRTLFLPDGTKVSPEWWASPRANVPLDAPDPSEETYALAVAWADQRLVPGTVRLTADPFDSDFDELQNSGYDLGTPFLLGPTSVDGRWSWTRGTLSDGWVDRRSLAVCDRATLEAWTARESVVVTAARAQLWSDPEWRQWKAWLRMGTRLPIEADEGSSWRVSVPAVGPEGRLTSVSGWIAKEEAVRGSLPYTRRTILQQAFKLLDRPYGWGDTYGEQDCSRFLAEVFSTVGVVLPRNSAAQGASGTDGGRFTRRDPVEAKAAAVTAADPATTMIRIDGHIMLLIGFSDGRPYVIHDVWAYTQNDAGRDLVRVINAVSVSTLELGTGGPRGSLLERVLNLRGVQPSPQP